jgi:hypothetical protein
VTGRDKFFVFPGLSGYRPDPGYFEVIALRGFDRAATRPVRHRVVGHCVVPDVEDLRHIELGPLAS